MVQQEINLEYLRELFFDDGNTAYHVNTDKNKKLNISVLPQPETNEPWNELMADREGFTNNYNEDISMNNKTIYEITDE